MGKSLQRFPNLPPEIKNHCTKRPKPTAPEQARIKKGVAGHFRSPPYKILNCYSVIFKYYFRGTLMASMEEQLLLMW